ncbi:beta-1,3-glucosyltransferase-like [Mya arenaria]|uniref:beta-1,3-glucosyltransferase-like n=1 Tax=Mya arenaria TaxID=6604 RepID=UPI0022E8DA5F|nr:beta-1,3-glucosyltransferase-like [Mya arenaria]
MVSYVDVSMKLLLIFAGVLPAYTCQAADSFDTKLSDAVIAVLSQPNPYHAGRARELQLSLRDQMKSREAEDKPTVYLTHKKFQGKTGMWTVFPLLEKLKSDPKVSKWIFICEEETRIDLDKFEKFIQQYDPAKEWFIGHALKDKESTIIHHFSPPEKLTFPDFAAGFLLSVPLLKNMLSRWPDDENFRADFSIDPKHELASYILMDDVKLTDAPELCLSDRGDNCVTYVAQTFPSCGEPINDDDLFIAVKTCEQFHTERVPVVLDTWAKESKNIEFYSETVDDSIPTIDLGVPNTERGHCGKTAALFKRAVTNENIKNKKWLLVADDDTIINIERLKRLLACYDPTGLIAIGERYGYRSALGDGYDYITGGGGMLFSMPMVEKLVEGCKCPQDDSPDDMIIGMCLKRFNIPITHVPYLHQARPDDYSEGYLSRQIPVSFHKHWNNDPRAVYRLLKSYDKQEQEGSVQTDKHTEL